MTRRIILGLGAGQCGLQLLAKTLNSQRDTAVSFEQWPLLPWRREPDAPGIRDRLARILATRKPRVVGDVASFYLPYVEEAVDFDSSIRMICLKRPQDEIVAGYCSALDKNPRCAVNHWAEEPGPGWQHDPFWSRIFPQYDTQDRVEGARRYWDEYYSLADELANRFPDQFRVYDTDVLTAEAGVREVLGFAGFSAEEQVVITGMRNFSGPPVVPAVNVPARPPLHPMDPRKCVILVPFAGFIHPACDEALKELERRGYEVRRVGGYAAIDQGRNQMATDALLEGYDETIWIDSDVGFHPNAIDQLRSHGLPIVAGVYPQKNKLALACHVMPGAPSMTFGKHGGLTELLYAGTGFLLIRREAYLTIQRKLKLPTCNERFGHAMIPFFQPMIRKIEEGYWYLAEDYAFCQRARDCGFRIMADTSIRLWHIGYAQFGWEDAGIERSRFQSFTLNFGEKPASTLQGASVESQPALDNFIREHAWPEQKPLAAPFPERNWLFPGTRELLSRSITPASRLIVEVGSWTGRSTRFLASAAPAATIIAVDHWNGSEEHRNDPELAECLPRLYETFLAECWEQRSRIIPVRADSRVGMQQIAEAGLQPDLIYLDADHRFESVRDDLIAALDLFPHAAIVGDDWDWEGVRQAVNFVAQDRGLRFETAQTGWKIMR